MGVDGISSFLWSVADLLRGDYKQSDYGKVILPFTVLRRLECVLAPTKAVVLSEIALRKEQGVNHEPFALRAAGQDFCNTSPHNLRGILGDPDHLQANLIAYLDAFSDAARSIFDHFDFKTQIARLDKHKLLFQVVERFSQADLSPANISNHEMGSAFEDLIRRFAEDSNETAGEHFTPREVIHLMTGMLFVEDAEILSTPGVVRSIYDPTAGTGGMLSIASEYIRRHNPKASPTVFGQELNPESFAICRADMLIKGQGVSGIVLGNTLTADGLPGEAFDYMLSNPPFGVDWKKIEKEVRTEHEDKGFTGRFGPGLPRVSDGSMLFLLHLLSKMRPPAEGGSRIAIVLNGSPLFTGGAGSGESEIRRHLIENDLVEAIVQLPTDMFYNTGISTYVWLITNRKPEHRKGKIQLIDASRLGTKMRKSLGNKRNELPESSVAEIIRTFGAFAAKDLDGRPFSKILPNEAFGYRSITVERPELGEDGKPVLGTKGKTKGRPIADTKRRDTESIPLAENVETYFKREVLPHAPDAWIDHDKTRVGYEVPFGRHFYVFQPPRQLDLIDEELKQSIGRIKAMIEGLSS